MATFHILNGDCLADQLRQTKINQNFIICRECLIEGNVYSDNIDDFWKIRAHFIADTYYTSTEEYFFKVVSEFEKIKNLPNNSEVCLWFENDLFCQTNMWFVISILANYPKLKIFRVFPIIENKADIWKGFGTANTKKLELEYDSKSQFKVDDIKLGIDLWEAYRKNDFIKLSQLAKSKSNCFQYLEEICQANMDRFPLDNSLSRPEKVIKQILKTKSKEFNIVFLEFVDKEGIYGFGNLQIKNLYDKMIKTI